MNPVIILGLTLFGSVYSQTSTAILYDQQNCQGNQVDASDQPQDLSKQDFDKKTVSARISGIWLFYEDIFHDFEGLHPMEAAYGNDRCVNLQQLSGKVSSVRYAGSYNGYTLDSLTVYPFNRFRGLSSFSEAEIFAFLGVNAIIVTGNSDWSVADRDGNHACLVVPDKSNNAGPSYLDDFLQNAPGLLGRYHTFTKGCTNEPKIYLKSIGEGIPF